MSYKWQWGFGVNEYVFRFNLLHACYFRLLDIAEILSLSLSLCLTVARFVLPKLLVILISIRNEKNEMKRKQVMLCFVFIMMASAQYLSMLVKLWSKLKFFTNSNSYLFVSTSYSTNLTCSTRVFCCFFVVLLASFACGYPLITFLFGIVCKRYVYL